MIEYTALHLFQSLKTHEKPRMVSFNGIKPRVHHLRIKVQPNSSMCIAHIIYIGKWDFEFTLGLIQADMRPNGC